MKIFVPYGPVPAPWTQVSAAAAGGTFTPGNTIYWIVVIHGAPVGEMGQSGQTVIAGGQNAVQFTPPATVYSYLTGWSLYIADADEVYRLYANYSDFTTVQTALYYPATTQPVCPPYWLFRQYKYTSVRGHKNYGRTQPLGTKHTTTSPARSATLALYQGIAEGWTRFMNAYDKQLWDNFAMENEIEGRYSNYLGTGFGWYMSYSIQVGVITYSPPSKGSYTNQTYSMSPGIMASDSGSLNFTMHWPGGFDQTKFPKLLIWATTGPLLGTARWGVVTRRLFYVDQFIDASNEYITVPIAPPKFAGNVWLANHQTTKLNNWSLRVRYISDGGYLLPSVFAPIIFPTQNGPIIPGPIVV